MEKNLHYNFIINHTKVVEKIESLFIFSATFLKLMIKIQKYFLGKIMEKNLHYNFIINYNKVAEKIESVQRFKYQNESVPNRWKIIFI